MSVREEMMELITGRGALLSRTPQEKMKWLYREAFARSEKNRKRRLRGYWIIIMVTSYRHWKRI
jgi:hypothetical protein